MRNFIQFYYFCQEKLSACGGFSSTCRDDAIADYRQATAHTARPLGCIKGKTNVKYFTEYT